MAPKVCRKTHKDLLLRSQKNVFMSLSGRKFVDKSCTRTFSGNLEKFGEKSFASPKICLLLHLCKGTSGPVAPPVKGQKGKCPAMPPFSGVPAHIILHALSLLVVVSYTVMNMNCQGSPKTAQFITAKISGNVLK